MADVILPLECISEYKLQLEALRAGTATLAPWHNQADVPRLIQEMEDKIRELEAHVANWGNSWQTEFE